MTIFEHLVQWAKASGMDPEPQTDSIVFRVSGKNGTWLARVTALEQDHMLYVTTAYPLHVPPEKRPQAAVELCILNGQIKLGTFYLNPDDGQMKFRISQFLWTEEDWAIRERVDELIMLAMDATDSYFRKLAAMGAEEAETAIPV